MPNLLPDTSEAQYPKQPVAALSGWYADVDDGLLPPHALSRVVNLRNVIAGQLTLRSGYEEHVVGGQRYPLAKCEYSITNYHFDATAHYYLGNLHVYFLDTVTGLSYFVQVRAGSSSDECSMVQYNDLLLLTIYGVGVYAIFPGYDEVTDGPDVSTWTVMPIGKEVCPTPPQVDDFEARPDDSTAACTAYAAEVEGDLYIYDNTPGNDYFPPRRIFDPGIDEPRTIPLALNATYFLIRNSADHAQSLMLPPRDTDDALTFLWKGAKTALDAEHFIVDQSLATRMQHRAWGYRFVFKRRFRGPKGNYITHYSQASADWWVGDMHYAPAQLLVAPNAYPEWTVDDQWVLRDDPDRFHDILDSILDGATRHSNFAPNESAFFDLQQKFRDYFQSVDATRDPYYWAAWWFGWRNTGGLPNFGMHCPYKAVVPASELKKAPCTRFTWADFDGPDGTALPADTVEVLIYRTAYSQPDDKDNPEKSPDFQPHEYLYVGSLSEEMEEFIDIVADKDRDPALKPEDHDGFLFGEFSGRVIGTYQNQVWLGDTETDYKLLPPAAIPYAVIFDPTDDTISLGWTLNHFYFKDAEDGDNEAIFYYRYIDESGLASEFHRIAVRKDGVAVLGTPVAAAFTIPRGYDGSIRRVNIWVGEMFSPAVVRQYRDLGTFSAAADDVAIVYGTESDVYVDDLPDADVTNDKDPGHIIFTEPGQPAFWPQDNREQRHPWGRVLGGKDIAGPLHVVTEANISLTELNGKAELMGDVGGISRFAFALVDKVLFYLSPHGLYLAEPSGPEPAPAHIHPEVMKYVSEQIPGQVANANARRAAMGWLGERRELWLYFPSSADLWGAGNEASALPQRLFIYRFPGSLSREVLNYEFDLTEDFEITYNEDDTETINEITDGGTRLIDTESLKSYPVIFSSHANGKMYSAHRQPDRGPDGAMIVLDNDVPANIWPGRTLLEKRWTAGDVTVFKHIRSLMWRVASRCAMKLGVGQKKPDNMEDSKGSLHGMAPMHDVILRNSGATERLAWQVSGPSYVTSGTTIVTLFETRPLPSGEHDITYKGLAAHLTPIHDHPAG